MSLYKLNMYDVAGIICNLGKDGENLINALRDEIETRTYNLTQVDVNDATSDLASVGKVVYDSIKSMLLDDRKIARVCLKDNLRLQYFNESKNIPSPFTKEKLFLPPRVQDLFGDDIYLLEERLSDVVAITSKLDELHDEGLIKIYDVPNSNTKLVLPTEINHSVDYRTVY